MGNPKRHRQEIRALIESWNKIVDKNERNALKQEQIMRRLRELGAVEDLPIAYSVTRRGRQAVQGALPGKPDGALS
jgi:Ni,Fe-hydrogenase III large subunit